MKKTALFALSLATAFVIVGCGGGDGDNENEGSTLGQGYYLDSAVEGLDYKCGNIEGFTDKNGKFKFEVGKNCYFYLGNIILRRLWSNELYNGGKFVDIKNAEILQSLDFDGNLSNGIQIDDNIKKLIKKEDINTTEKLKEKLSALVTEAKQEIKGFKGEVVGDDKIKEHLINTIKNNIIIPLFANKTFYAVEKGEDSESYSKISFNKDVSKVTENGKEESIKIKIFNGEYYLCKNEKERIYIVKDAGKYIEVRVVVNDEGETETLYLYKNEADAKKAVSPSENINGFTAYKVDKDELLNKKIYFNGGKSYIKIKDNNVELKDGRESGDDSFIYENKALVLWANQPYKYEVYFGSPEVKVGTKLLIKKEGGKDTYTTTISKIENL